MPRKAARVSALAKDITEYLETLTLEPTGEADKLTVAYHSACSMQHGQQIREAPKKLLKKAGFKVKDVPESHICCGSAGTYNILQPEIAEQLRARKVGNIERTPPRHHRHRQYRLHDADRQGPPESPIVHTAELLDWATGGPRPQAVG